MYDVLDVNPALDGGEWWFHAPAALPPWKECRDLRAGLDVVERNILPLSGKELQFIGSPARSPALKRLSYPGSKFNNETHQLTHKFQSLG
jgi:hypothetical protein